MSLQNFKWAEIISDESFITKTSAMYLIPVGSGSFKMIVVDDEGNIRVLESSGQDGKSAYELAVEEGFIGSEVQWLQSLKGINGKSAYQIALDGGFTGTSQEWLESLVGVEGKSAYQVAVEAGFSGTNLDWLDSLKGDTGEAATIDVGTVVSVGPNDPPDVNNSGSNTNAIFNFSIPKGDTGEAATVTVGTVTTLPPGSNASVVNAGDSNNAIFNFSIPQGQTGQNAILSYNDDFVL